ncbi:EAL domain-containing protein [Uliginosibacterium aquaticum]|uniref:histidine kinase n=1 Tax=Uliginosibacterium aquaticum TaxID=2731212 RepID=A0ABX2IE32_9RHOO|nr:EAL domain-containing protein [Uliginosibacterium aquaticum]NSL54889.1 EAL domain-containing protein [Uliginosibacterium aquaticum]
MPSARPTIPLPEYQRLFDAAPGLYLVLDPELRIVAVNQAYATATMTRREDILGKGMFEVFPDNPDDPEAEGVRNLRVSLLRVLQTGQADAMPVQKYDIRKPVEEGGGFEARYWSPLNSPVLGDDGQLAYIIHRVEDVTEFVRLKQQGIEESRLNDTLRQQALRMETEVFARAREVAEASAQLKSANEELDRLYHKTRELDELKTRFFANVSHELRTPLTLILGPLVSLLESSRLNDVERRSLQVVQRNARLLHRQVDNLLDLAKLDAGHMSLHYAEFDLAGLLRVFASNFDTLAADRKILYELDCPPQLKIQADVQKCERILLNLLSNAFKFVPDGGIIRISLHQAADEVVLEIRDSGPGIPEDMRETVFERFRQLEDSAERRVGGTGLGLSIVREFVALQHGSVTVTRAPEGGAAFLVRLPDRAPPGSVMIARLAANEASNSALLVEEARPPRQPSELASGQADAPLILVIEDNPDMNAFISSALAGRYQVANAFDGNTGLQLALDLLPALILSDVMMPGMSGDRLVDIIRQHPDLDDTPIIMLTAKADDALRAKLLRHGVQDYIQKPFTVDDLQARIAGLLKERRRVGRQLLSLEERFRATFEQAAVGIAHVAPDGRWLRVNRKLCEIVGYSYAELLKLTFQDITHPDDLDLDIGLVGQVLSGELGSYELEKRYITKSGQIVWIKLTVALVRNEDGAAEYFISVVEDISPRKAAEQALQESEERFRLIAATIPEVIWLIESSPLRYVYVSPAYESIWQRPRKALYENPLAKLQAIDEADRERVGQIKQQAMDAGRPFELEYRVVRPDGSRRWVHESSRPVVTRHGPVGRYVGIAHDVTDSRQADERLRQAATVFESAREAVIIAGLSGEILAVNQAFTDITGYAEAEVLGHNPRILRSDRHGPEFFQGLWASLRRTGQWQGEIWNRHKSGEIYLCRMTISPVLDENHQASRYVALMTDISQQRRSEEQLAHLAHYDPLTDLPNRLLLQSRLEHSLSQAARSRRRVAVLFVNLDRFQTVNDSLGHKAGDQVLVEVGARLRQRVRREDTLGRLGSDEFMLILESIGGPEAAAEVAHAILAALAAPFNLPDSAELYIGASIGISIHPDDGMDANELLRNADTALHQAKAQGRNRFCFYAAAMNAEALQKLELDAALRKAIERQEFVLHYQAKAELHSGCICGAEALIRWRQADGSLVSPGEFIPLAEATGLIVPIGAWVIDESCRQLRAWHDEGMTECRLALNVSARQFHAGNLPAVVEEALVRHRLDAGSLELELTESMLMDDPQHTIEVLQTLKQLGVRLSLDDFGTGYSSFGYLQRFPIDALKIDQSFVRDISSDQGAAVIAAAIIDLAHRLGLKVVGEGVETQAQLECLRAQGCDEIQGYYFARPLPATAFAALYQEGKPLRKEPPE